MLKTYRTAMLYRTRRTLEQIAPIQLKIEALADLNEAIDQLFEWLERHGRAADLGRLAPYFGVVWASGRALAEFLAQARAGDLAGLQVLEVGCGLALPSLVAIGQGAEVTAVDSHPEVPKFLVRNLEANPELARERLRFESLDWSNPDAMNEAGLGRFDLVMGSDVLYERSHAADLGRVPASQLAPGGRVLLTDPGRPYLQEFADTLKRHGISCETKVLRTAENPASAGDSKKTREIFLLDGRRSA